MIEILNAIIFSVTCLFGFENSDISEQTILKINTKENSIHLEYKNIQTYKEHEKYTKQMISMLDTMSVLGKDFKGLNLVSKELIQTDTCINIMIDLTYDTNQTLKDIFKIDIDSGKLFIHYAESVFVDSGEKLDTKIEIGESINFQQNSKSLIIFNYLLQ